MKKIIAYIILLFVSSSMFSQVISEVDTPFERDSIREAAQRQLKGSYEYIDILNKDRNNHVITTTSREKINLIEYTSGGVHVQGLNNKINATVNISYVDGLGRPIQTVERTNGNLTNYQEYDNQGRESSSWLPMPINGSGSFTSLNIIRERAKDFYPNETKAYETLIYEPSPLNKVKEKYGAGRYWYDNNKSIKTLYFTNTDNTILQTRMANTNSVSRELVLETGNLQSGTYKSCETILLKPGFQFKSSTDNSFHAYTDPSYCEITEELPEEEGEILSEKQKLECYAYSVKDDGNLYKENSPYKSRELYVVQTINEEGNQHFEFKDKLGQMILSRSINNGKAYDTYYAYNKLGNLSYVLPPIVADQLKNHPKGARIYIDDILKQYVYVYKYDGENRCIQKNLPGAEPIYYVYDKVGQLIFTQDGENRRYGISTKEWIFNKYDVFGRVVISGIHKTNETQANLIAKCKDIVVKELPAGVFGYSWTHLKEIDSEGTFLVNYYDDYDHLLNLNTEYKNKLSYNPDNDYDKIHLISELSNKTPKGLLTGTIARIFQDDGTISGEIVTAMYYDNRGRLIQKKSTNYIGGTDSEYLSYNFIGDITKKKIVHSALNMPTQTELYTYTYDKAGRLQDVKHKLNTEPEVLIASNSYDEFGRLKIVKKAANKLNCLSA